MTGVSLKHLLKNKKKECFQVSTVRLVQFENNQEGLEQTKIKIPNGERNYQAKLGHVLL